MNAAPASRVDDRGASRRTADLVYDIGVVRIQHRETRMRTLIFMLAGALAPAAQAAPQEPVWALAQKEKPAVIETLRELVNIESGSRDKEGLDRLAAHLGERLAALGAKVEFYEPGAADTYRLFDTPKDIGKVVIGRFQGSGARRVMLLADMGTVYSRGTL